MKRKDARAAPLGSDRSFGIVFAGIFALIGLWRIVHRMPPRWWAVAIAAALLILAVARPSWLRPLNWVWSKLGHLLNRIISPVILGLLYFVILSSIGYLRRKMGKDSLGLKYLPEASTYWIERVPPGPPGDTLRRQF